MKNILLVQLGERIRLERERLNLAVTDFKGLIGVHRNSQSNYEAGLTDIPISYFFKLKQHGFNLNDILEVDAFATTHAEQELLLLYRSLPADVQQQVRDLVKTFANSSNSHGGQAHPTVDIPHE